VAGGSFFRPAWADRWGAHVEADNAAGDIPHLAPAVSNRIDVDSARRRKGD